MSATAWLTREGQIFTNDGDVEICENVPCRFTRYTNPKPFDHFEVDFHIFGTQFNVPNESSPSSLCTFDVSGSAIWDYADTIKEATDPITYSTKIAVVHNHCGTLDDATYLILPVSRAITFTDSITCNLLVDGPVTCTGNVIVTIDLTFPGVTAVTDNVSFNLTPTVQHDECSTDYCGNSPLFTPPPISGYASMPGTYSFSQSFDCDEGNTHSQFDLTVIIT